MTNEKVKVCEIVLGFCTLSIIILVVTTFIAMVFAMVLGNILFHLDSWLERFMFAIDFLQNAPIVWCCSFLVAIILLIGSFASQPLS